MVMLSMKITKLVPYSYTSLVTNIGQFVVRDRNERVEKNFGKLIVYVKGVILISTGKNTLMIIIDNTLKLQA